MLIFLGGVYGRCHVQTSEWGIWNRKFDMENHLLSWYSGVGNFRPRNLTTVQMIQDSFWGKTPCFQMLLLLVSGMVSHFSCKIHGLEFYEPQVWYLENGWNLVAIIEKNTPWNLDFLLYTVHHFFPFYYILALLITLIFVDQTLKIINDMKPGQVVWGSPKGMTKFYRVDRKGQRWRELCQEASARIFLASSTC